MCHFITATLPHNVSPQSVASIFDSHKLGFELISNPHVSSQIESGDSYILTTRGQVLLHWYHGGIASERIDISGREKVRLAELSPERLMKMKEDTLYEFVA